MRAGAYMFNICLPCGVGEGPDLFCSQPYPQSWEQFLVYCNCLINKQLNQWNIDERNNINYKKNFPSTLIQKRNTIHMRNPSHFRYCSILLLLWKWKCYLLSCVQLFPIGLFCPWDTPGQITGVGCHSLFQGIFPTQGLNSCLQTCRQILWATSEPPGKPPCRCSAIVGLLLFSR